LLLQQLPHFVSFSFAAVDVYANCVVIFCMSPPEKKTAAKKQKSGKASARTGRLPQSINANFVKRNQEHDSCYPLPRISAEDFTHISFNL